MCVEHLPKLPVLVGLLLSLPALVKRCNSRTAGCLLEMAGEVRTSPDSFINAESWWSSCCGEGILSTVLQTDYDWY